MNYLSEINAFENWCECNYIPSTVKLLWYELMWLNNRTGWVEWFSAINPYVMCRIGVSSEPNFIKLRNHLKQMGRIEFKSEHILSAITYIDTNGIPSYRNPKKYMLSYNKSLYPPKYLICIANKFVNGFELSHKDFKGGNESNKFLSDLGFTIIEK